MPMFEDLSLLDTDPAKVRAQAYDLVINGEEGGGGTIRCHDPAIQSKIFALLGLTPEEAEEKFGFLLSASATAPRPTAASRWGSTGWSCSTPGSPTSATASPSPRPPRGPT